jgi:hypothetical protein
MVQLAASVQGLHQAAGFFLAYLEYRRRASIGYAHGHFCAIAVPTAYTVIFVHYDFVASIIASSLTSLLRQLRTSSAPLFVALRLAAILEPP